MSPITKNYMRKFSVLKDCFCEGYLHELVNYPRPNLVEKKLSKGDIVTFVEEFRNNYGRFVTVIKDSIKYDIKKDNLIPIY